MSARTPGPWDCVPYGLIGFEVGASESVALVNYVKGKRLEWLRKQPLTQADGLPWPGRAQELADLEADYERARANARLIAAAPELLTALESMLSEFGARLSDGKPIGYTVGSMDRALALVRGAEAAIRKATGENDANA